MPVVAGKAALSTGLLGAGTHALKAYYAGNATYAANTSPVLLQTLTAVAENGLQSAVSYPFYGGSWAVAVGDFNGDGKADFAVVNRTGYVSVMLGNGSGSFQWAGNFNTSFDASSVAVGDFNGDGKADLAVASRASVSVLLGNGNGTFQPVVVYAAGSQPAHKAFAFGSPAGDVFVTGDWYNSGPAKAGAFRSGAAGVQSFEWVLDANGGHTPDLVFNLYGVAGDQPVTGKW